MARPTRRRDHSQVESDSAYVARSIQAGKLAERSTWVPGFFRALLIPVPFVAFASMCIDFLPEVNVMNIVACLLTTLVTVFVLIRIPQHLLRRNKLLYIPTGLLPSDNQRVAIAACNALGWRIIRSNQYLLIAAPNPDNYTRTHKYAAQLATIMFDQHSQHIYVGTKDIYGDETVVLNSDRRMTKRLAASLKSLL